MNVNQFGLEAQVNGIWLESERPIPYQRKVTKFLELTGIARLAGKNNAEPVSMDEFVQIVERDQIKLNANWKESDETFKAALKNILELVVGVIGEKRKAAGATETSSSTQEPPAKKQKIGPSTSETELLTDPQLATIMQAIGPSFLPDLGKVIQSYCGNEEGEKALGDYLCTTYRASYHPLSTWVELPRSALQRAKKFLQQHNINPKTLASLSLPCMQWNALRPIRERESIYGDAFDGISLFKEPDDDLLLQLVHDLVPKLKQLSIKDWCWNLGPYRNKIVKTLIRSLSKFTELDTLEFSYHDFTYSPYQDSSYSWILKNLSLCLKNAAAFPKLKTIRIVGGVLSDEETAKLKEHRPNLVVVCDAPAS